MQLLLHITLWCCSVSAFVTAGKPFGDHSWNTARDFWWGDFGYSVFTQEQATWLANNYKVVSLEKCTGEGQGVKSEEGIYRNAAMLKAVNPDVKVMFYWSVTQAGITCYDNYDVFNAHPEWWLKDDNGNVVGTGGMQDGRRIDVMNPQAVEWWLSVPFEKYNSSLIDGILADDGGYNVIPNISRTRLDALYDAKLELLQKMQAKFDARPEGGVVFGNGLSEYDQSPSDPHNRRILSYAGGVQNEHFAAFEQVNYTGALNMEKVSDVLDQIEWAATTSNGSKQIFCSFWAGPYTGFANGEPKYADNSQPCGEDPNCTLAEKNRGWQAALTKYLPFNLAAFLTVAESNTWFTQAVWYEIHQGFVPCPEDPDSCMAPPGFYADVIGKPLGAPLGKRISLGQYKWRREFAHATVTLNLEDPIGGTSIVFNT